MDVSPIKSFYLIVPLIKSNQRPVKLSSPIAEFLKKIAFLTPRCHSHRGIWLSGVNDTTELFN